MQGNNHTHVLTSEIDHVHANLLKSKGNKLLNVEGNWYCRRTMIQSFNLVLSSFGMIGCGPFPAFETAGYGGFEGRDASSLVCISA
jgi:type II secretory pathway component PulL